MLLLQQQRLLSILKPTATTFWHLHCELTTDMTVTPFNFSANKDTKDTQQHRYGYPFAKTHTRVQSRRHFDVPRTLSTLEFFALVSSCNFGNLAPCCLHNSSPSSCFIEVHCTHIRTCCKFIAFVHSFTFHAISHRCSTPC